MLPPSRPNRQRRHSAKQEAPARLPVDILLQIFSTLSISDILNIRQVRLLAAYARDGNFNIPIRPAGIFTKSQNYGVFGTFCFATTYSEEISSSRALGIDPSTQFPRGSWRNAPAVHCDYTPSGLPDRPHLPERHTSHPSPALKREISLFYFYPVGNNVGSCPSPPSQPSERIGSRYNAGTWTPARRCASPGLPSRCWPVTP